MVLKKYKQNKRLSKENENKIREKVKKVTDRTMTTFLGMAGFARLIQESFLYFAVKYSMIRIYM